MKNIVFLLFITFCFAILSKHNTYGNCDTPPPCPPPFAFGYPEVQWISGGCVEVEVEFPNGKKCMVCVCYCWRDIGAVAPFIEIVITKLSKVDTTCDSSPYSLPEIWKYTGEAIIKQNPGNLNWYCPPCPEEVTNYSIYFGSCWDFSTPPAQCPGVTYCKITYGVCCNLGVRNVRYIQTEAIGGTCEDDCNYDCP